MPRFVSRQQMHRGRELRLAFAVHKRPDRDEARCVLQVPCLVG